MKRLIASIVLVLALVTVLAIPSSFRAPGTGNVILSQLPVCADDGTFVSNGSAAECKVIPDSDTAGHVLQYDNTTNAFGDHTLVTADIPADTSATNNTIVKRDNNGQIQAKLVGNHVSGTLPLYSLIAQMVSQCQEVKAYSSVGSATAEFRYIPSSQPSVVLYGGTASYGTGTTLLTTGGAANDIASYYWFYNVAGLGVGFGDAFYNHYLHANIKTSATLTNQRIGVEFYAGGDYTTALLTNTSDTQTQTGVTKGYYVMYSTNGAADTATWHVGTSDSGAAGHMSWLDTGITVQASTVYNIIIVEHGDQTTLTSVDFIINGVTTNKTTLLPSTAANAEAVIGIKTLNAASKTLNVQTFGRTMCPA